MPEQEPLDVVMLRLESESLRIELTAVQAELQTLRGAVETRQLIGQATGLMAAQLSLNTEQAWNVLRRVSSLANRKMRDIAVVVIAAHDGTLDHPEAGYLGQSTEHGISRAIARQLADALPIALRQERRHVISSLANKANKQHNRESERTSASDLTGSSGTDASDEGATSTPVVNDRAGSVDRWPGA